MAYEIKNSFHNTTTTIRKGGRISERQARRIKNRLCGIAGCTCSGSIGERGPQTCSIDYDSDNGAIVGEKQIT